MTQVSVRDLFGVDVPANFLVEVLDDSTNPYIPSRDDYIFRRESLRDLLAFLTANAGDALYITGPTGSGKTSLVIQTAARLNWPVQAVTCHGRLETRDLIGGFRLVQGQTVFVHGPLAVAARDGHILLLNEMDLMDPAELAGLNEIMGGGTLVIPENGGEIIRPHPRFRFVATGNSAGGGDRTGLYQGILRQNLAFMDRFRFVEIGYPSPEEETQILERLCPAIPETARNSMIRVANEIRRLFIGGKTEGGELSITMSTRTLIRWGHLMMVFRRAPNPVEYALERALLVRAAPEEREAILQISRNVFGGSP